MAFVTLPLAKKHLRITHAAEDENLALYIDAAEAFALAYIGANVYVDEVALGAAQVNAPGLLATATTDYEAAREAASSMEIGDGRTLAESRALDLYRSAVIDYQRTMWGIVADARFQTGVLLILSNLWEHRGDEEEPTGVPKAARVLLAPLRAQGIPL